MRTLFAALLLTLTGCADLLPGTYDADLVITQTGSSALNETPAGRTVAHTLQCVKAFIDLENAKRLLMIAKPVRIKHSATA